MDKSLHVMLMYFITHLGLIFFMFPADIIRSTTQGHWLPILLGIGVHLSLLAIYMKGMSYFHKKDIVNIYLGVGKGIAVIFLLPITLFLLLTIIVTLRSFSEIVAIFFLSNTPLWAITSLFLLISMYIASKGLEAIFRTGILLALLFLPLIMFVLVNSFQYADWRYTFPIFDVDFSFITKRPYLESYFAFAGGFLFLGFVQPYFTFKRKKIMIAALVLMPIFIFAVYIPILTFGQATASTFLFPFVAAVDTLDINWLMFDRVTMFFLLSVITFIMLFTSLLLWKITRIVHECIPTVKFGYIVISLSAAIFIICMMIPDWKDVEKLLWWNTYLRFFTQFIVPASLCYFGYRSKRKIKLENL
jgi:spore germination protein (amino acid permease)